jgi:hydrogenase expression/formation protein HypE
VLGKLGASRPETLVHAQLGVDAAVVAFDGNSACVLTTDPITTATHGAGRLALHVVCNDLACMGAEPVGVLATLLFPAGISSSAIAALCDELDATARSLSVEILGGHTEIAPGLQSPLVVMTGVGRAPRDRILSATGAQPGNELVLTKAAGLEGTHILANDFSAQLASVPARLLAEARSYAAELSVLGEARIAADLGATALHDPTEAGVVGALWELAEASGTGFEVRVDRIPVREPTRAICAALGADPLRLIASGALLIACPDGGAMASALLANGIPASLIGVLTFEPARVLAHPDGRRESIEELGRDELYRLLEPPPEPAG